MEHQEFGWQTTDSLRLFAQEWQPDGPAQGVVCTHNEPEQQEVLAVIVDWLQAHTPTQ
ncbi:MAG: hypothetical protein L0332_16405 [Chloroflexi bacterium]|nr:hypothetical protein [Chloroflexota bacterium]MCI0578126.1 hypothetical protein [Chloroflexota bacterium]MCI0645184.1 hypothetical protein [Chloroflexota bacterium]MCI0728282.1 hypothetical protein [Chloroflexota bacterium]